MSTSVGKIAFLPVMLAIVALMPQPLRAETVRGQILSIEQRMSVVWVRGEYCRSPSMCEGVIYGTIRVALETGRVVTLERLVLLHPETTNCRTGDAYWASSVVEEAFSPDRKGSIEGHPYSQIVIGMLEAVPIDLTAVTDRAMGFAAVGSAYLGSIELTVKFDAPFPEDVHAQSFCKEGTAGINPIHVKTLHIGGRAQPSIGTRNEVARRLDAE